jgi:DNA-binding transcriptional MerR regulator
MSKAADAFRTISEVADDLEVPKHVLRFWEARFPQIKPMKRGGGRRYYRPADMDLLRGIRHLLHNEGYTIKGVQKILRLQGLDAVKTCWQPGKGLEAPTGRETTNSRAAASRGAKPRGRAAATGNEALMARVIAELTAVRAILSGDDAAPAAPVKRRARG